MGLDKLATSKADQVTKIRRIIEELGFQAASAAEVRDVLKLKGADLVKF